MLIAATPVMTMAGVVINEIHYSPDPKTAKLEYVELVNSGPTAVDLGGARRFLRLKLELRVPAASP